MSDATPHQSSDLEHQNPDQPSSNLTTDDKSALKFHQDRLAAKKRGKLKSLPFNDKKPQTTAMPPRVRSSADVDLSKANPNCKRCNGNGVRHYQIVPETKERIPVICKCVSRNGGIKKDQLDRILAGKLPSAEEIARSKKRR